MIAAFRLGRNSEAMVPTRDSTTTRDQQAAVGRQVGAEQARSASRPPWWRARMPCSTRSTICSGSVMTVVAEDGMGQREGHGPQGVGRLGRREPQPVVVRLEQRGDARR